MSTSRCMTRDVGKSRDKSRKSCDRGGRRDNVKFGGYGKKQGIICVA